MRFALALLLAMTAGPAFAIDDLVAKIEACLGRIGDPGEHPELCMGIHVNACVAAPGGETDAGQTACLTEETEAWDRILAKEYAAPLSRLDEDQRAALKDAQRKWTAFLEADCDFPLIFEKSALAGPWAADCRMQHTARRTTELRGYLNYLEY